MKAKLMFGIQHDGELSSTRATQTDLHTIPVYVLRQSDYDKAVEQMAKAMTEIGAAKVPKEFKNQWRKSMINLNTAHARAALLALGIQPAKRSKP